MERQACPRNEHPARNLKSGLASGGDSNSDLSYHVVGNFRHDFVVAIPRVRDVLAARRWRGKQETAVVRTAGHHSSEVCLLKNVAAAAMVSGHAL